MIGVLTPATCRWARSRMLDGIAGRLDVRVRLDVQDHVARCVGCARELADLAASQNAARRAFDRYRWLRSRVAPGRSRLLAFEGTRAARRRGLLHQLPRRAEALVGAAVLLFAILGSGPSTQLAGDTRLFPHRYTRAADDPAGLIGASMIGTSRIPVADGAVIDVTPLPALPGSVDRPGLQ